LDKTNNMYEELIRAWEDYINLLSTITPILPSLGMIQSYRKRMVDISKELISIYKSIIQFNETMPKYDQMIFTTWLEATKKALERFNKENITDKEEIKNIWIETLEQEFTELFNSDEFGIISNKLLNSENEINKHIANIVEIYSKAFNIPSRSEIDDIYGEVTRLKREIKKLSDKVKRLESTLTVKN